MRNVPPSLSVGRDLLLRDYSTFKIGGAARFLARVTDDEELKAILSYCHDTQQPFLVVGKGSNCLFDDRGFNGVVIINRLMDYCEVAPGLWRAGAGVSISRFAAVTAQKGWGGLEFATAIPGTVGGAVFMNGGASGMTTADNLVEVDFLHPDGTLEHFSKAALTFGYRTSSFQNLPGVIVAATFSLKNSDDAEERRQQISLHRRAIHPYDVPSAGCIFRNPLEASAGALIERAGLKGLSFGGAAVSEKHANFIVNKGGATAADVLALIEEIRQTVYARFGIMLENEIRYISPDRLPP